MSAQVDAAANGDVVEVQRLLKEGASVNELDQWPYFLFTMAAIALW
jgi:hypothetical protein